MAIQRFCNRFVRRMRRFSLLAVLAILCLASCKKEKTAETDETPVSPVEQEPSALPDSTLWGHLGEDTGMSTLQFITDQGDTLELYRTNPYTGEDGRLVGEVRNYSDRFAITLSPEYEALLTAINATQLTQTWTTDEGELDIRGDGTVNSQTLPYSGWKLWNGHLLFATVVQQEYGTVTRIDTLDIVSLDDDSLIVRNHINQQISFSRKP